MHILRQLSNYRVADELTVIDANTGEIVELQQDNSYLLTTDEVIELELTNKTINLKRRFTPAMVSKLLESGTKVVQEMVQSGTSSENGTEKMVQTQNLVQDLEEMVQESLKNGTSYVINGTKYGTLREASKATGTAVMTLKRWFDKEINGCTRE